MDVLGLECILSIIVLLTPCMCSVFSCQAVMAASFTGFAVNKVSLVCKTGKIPRTLKDTTSYNTAEALQSAD